MTSLSREETLAAKRGYKHIANKHGDTLKRYHSGNGHFGEKLFRDACVAQVQELTFCGVGTHYQNGIRENRIKLLTLDSSTLLLHAKRHWPEYVTSMLWPYTLKAAE
eukprot:10452691-Ditylum_brightwellii.AAC.1